MTRGRAVRDDMIRTRAAHRWERVFGAGGAALLLAFSLGCGSSATSAGTAAPTTTMSPSTADSSGAGTAAPGSTTVSSSPGTSGAGAAVTAGGAPTWVGTVDATKLPLGDGRTSTSTPGVGTLYGCSAGDPRGGGASKDGPWIHGSTWDSTAKVAVEGSRTWPTAEYQMTTTATARNFTTNDLPAKQVTGTFPIAASDPAHTYDQNPNSIKAKTISLSVPLRPTAAAAPRCVPGGPIGILGNGVVLFDAVDATNRDAVAHETQDVCQGHPAPGDTYHYHSVPACILTASEGSSTLVGWATDGYPILVERDAQGALPTNADLDACHGRTSSVVVDGQAVDTYHYDATLEFPYTIGCFHGAAAS